MGQRWIEVDNILSTQAIDAGSAAYSSVLNAMNPVGTYGALQIETLTTVSVMIVVTQQVSCCGQIWMDPTNSTLTAAGAVYNALTAATRVYIPYTPVIAPYIRFKVVPVATTVVALKHVFQGEKA